MTPTQRSALYALFLALQPVAVALGLALGMETYALLVDALLGVVVAFTAGSNINAE